MMPESKKPAEEKSESLDEMLARVGATEVVSVPTDGFDFVRETFEAIIRSSQGIVR